MIEELKRLIKEATALPWYLLYEVYEAEDDDEALDIACTPIAVGLFDEMGEGQPLIHGEDEEGDSPANLRLAHAAVNALPALIAAAEAVQAWAAADSAGRTAAQSDNLSAHAAAWRAVQAAEALLHTAATGREPQPRRYDRAGCDVTDLPGLWDESDTMKEPTQ
jgi:hypothetical protein